MRPETEKQSPNPTSSVGAMPSEKPPQLFWDLEQKKNGKGWDYVAKMEDPPHEYQIAACFLSDGDKKKYVSSVFTTQARLRKNYEKLKPFNEASRTFCIEKASRARKAQKNV